MLLEVRRPVYGSMLYSEFPDLLLIKGCATLNKADSLIVLASGGLRERPIVGYRTKI